MIPRIRSRNITMHLMGITITLWVAIAFAATQTAAKPVPQQASASAPTLDYEFFKTRVEPIFLKKREGHARCYSCHNGAGGPAYLQRLSPGATFWTEQQSRLNFERISTTYVTPGNPDASYIVMHPLAPEAGGDTRTGFHGGGRQFRTKDDPDRQVIVQWILGEKASGSVTQ